MIVDTLSFITSRTIECTYVALQTGFWFRLIWEFGFLCYVTLWCSTGRFQTYFSTMPLKLVNKHSYKPTCYLLAVFLHILSDFMLHTNLSLNVFQEIQPCSAIHFVLVTDYLCGPDISLITFSRRA